MKSIGYQVLLKSVLAILVFLTQQYLILFKKASNASHMVFKN